MSLKKVAKQAISIKNGSNLSIKNGQNPVDASTYVQYKVLTMAITSRSCFKYFVTHMAHPLLAFCCLQLCSKMPWANTILCM